MDKDEPDVCPECKGKKFARVVTQTDPPDIWLYNCPICQGTGVNPDGSASSPQDRLLTINEWLDAIGCDRAYKKDMKETYQKAQVELKAQDTKTASILEVACQGTGVKPTKKSKPDYLKLSHEANMRFGIPKKDIKSDGSPQDRLLTMQEVEEAHKKHPRMSKIRAALTEQDTQTASILEAERAGLFQLGGFTLHSGAKSNWKIDCDALTDKDWEALAYMIYEKLGEPRFRKVIGIPTGGLKLANALERYRFPSPKPKYPILIVDDVLTTGNSMEEMKAKTKGEVIGAVVFARDECPDWVVPLFGMSAEAEC